MNLEYLIYRSVGSTATRWTWGADLDSRRRVRWRNWTASWSRRRRHRPGTSWCGSVWWRTCWSVRRAREQTARTTEGLHTRATIHDRSV